MFADMLEAEKDADIAVVMGDLPDCYAFSSFTKYESVPWAEEWAAVGLDFGAVPARGGDLREP